MNDSYVIYSRQLREKEMPSYEEHPVHEVLADMGALVKSKASDYADDQNVYSNFEGAARLTNGSVDNVFHVILGIKMERLRQLMSGKTPNHESLDDTLMDAANYFALWLGYRRSQEVKLYNQVADTIGTYAVPPNYEIELDKIDGSV